MARRGSVGPRGPRRTSSVSTSWKSRSSCSKALDSKPSSEKLSFCAAISPASAMAWEGSAPKVVVVVGKKTDSPVTCTTQDARRWFALPPPIFV